LFLSYLLYIIFLFCWKTIKWLNLGSVRAIYEPKKIEAIKPIKPIKTTKNIIPIIIEKVTTGPIHNGAKIHNHDHVITSHNFKIRNTKNNILQNPIPEFLITISP